jgi:Protein of unknown function (DUF1376)
MTLIKPLPAPMTTLEMDVSGLDCFQLNTEKLMASELWAIASGDEFKAAVGLWCRAWKQKPAGSLPNDERVLAAFSGNAANWKKIRDVALHGFVLCSDGRLYHETLSADVARAATAKADRKARTEKATQARKKERNVQRDDERDVDQNSNVTTSHRRELEGNSRGDKSPLQRGDGFSEFWEVYPARGGNSDMPAAKMVYYALIIQTPPETIIAAASAYAAWCKENGKTGTQYVKQAKTWLSNGMWQEWEPKAIASVPSGILVKRGSDAWNAWQAVKKTPCSDRHDGWFFPTEWPLEQPIETSLMKRAAS